MERSFARCIPDPRRWKGVKIRGLSTTDPIPNTEIQLSNCSTLFPLSYQVQFTKHERPYAAGPGPGSDEAQTPAERSSTSFLSVGMIFNPLPALVYLHVKSCLWEL